jgi:hypothetical protein
MVPPEQEMAVRVLHQKVMAGMELNLVQVLLQDSVN